VRKPFDYCGGIPVLFYDVDCGIIGRMVVFGVIGGREIDFLEKYRWRW